MMAMATNEKSWFYTVIGELSDAANAHQPPDFRDKTIEACWKAMNEHALELTVIEAAEALLVDNLPLQLRMDRLTDAVHALQVQRKVNSRD
jgi:hypothetical protein